MLGVNVRGEVHPEQLLSVYVVLFNVTAPLF